nr:hypothetical protein [Pseudobacteroides cellulosolvens]
MANYLEKFDTVIIILPLYIHAMPGIVMKFIEHLKPTSVQGKSIGFIIQAGFIETAQEFLAYVYLKSIENPLDGSLICHTSIKR